MRRLPLRVRLVAGFVVAMLVLLTAAGAFVYWRVEYALDRSLDVDLAQAASVIAPLVSPSGRVSDPAAEATGAGWQVVDGDDQVLDSGGLGVASPLVDARELARARTGALTLDVGSLLPVTARPYRVRVLALGSSGHYLVVAVRRDHRDEALRELLAQLTLAGLGALVIAALVGDLLARAALRPVERYRRRAAEIADGAGGLRLEVPADRDDEVTRLGHTLNDMLASLERALELERRFVDDASHELRTPITLLKGRIQLARRRERSVAEHEAILAELEVDIGRLAALAEELLALGSAEHTPDAETDVAPTIDRAIDRAIHGAIAGLGIRHPEVSTTPTVLLTDDSLCAAIAPGALERILVNLIDNAVLHGAAPVVVRARLVSDARAGARFAGWVVVEVSDAGHEMTTERLSEATQRFTRSPEARTRPGAGLGLAIVEEAVRRAHGELRLCVEGQHTHHGTPIDAVACDHDERMTATVIVPATRARPTH